MNAVLIAIGHMMWVIPLTFVVIAVAANLVETEGGVAGMFRWFLISALIITYPFVMIFLLTRGELAPPPL